MSWYINQLFHSGRVHAKKQPHLLAGPDQYVAVVGDFHALKNIAVANNHGQVNDGPFAGGRLIVLRILSIATTTERHAGIQTLRFRPNSIRVERVCDELLPFSENHVRVEPPNSDGRKTVSCPVGGTRPKYSKIENARFETEPPRKCTRVTSYSRSVSANSVH